MNYLIVGILGFFAGFFFAALMSANKCGECQAQRMEAERTVEDACPYKTE